MNEKVKAALLGLVFVAIVAALVWLFWLRPSPPPAAPSAPLTPIVTNIGPTKSGKPLLMDVGTGAGPADQMMAAVMLTLRTGFRGVLEVEFVNVRKDPSAREKYGVTVLPTQIYWAPDGRELARHEGYASEQEIVDKWRSLGYDLMTAAPTLDDLLGQTRSAPAPAPTPSDAE